MIFIIGRITLHLMLWVNPIKNNKEKAIHVQFALSVHKGQVKYIVSSKEAYRPPNFVLNFG